MTHSGKISHYELAQPGGYPQPAVKSLDCMYKEDARMSAHIEFSCWKEREQTQSMEHVILYTLKTHTK